jgi:nucleoside-diphosphate-sugar epimerase
MRILVTGSSGQIGTNLALRLAGDGHDVFGVDKRLNTWTDEFRYLLQDLSGHYPSFPGGIGGVEYPEVDLVIHLAAHAKVHQLVRQPHRALENAVMTFNVLEFCRQQKLPIVFSSSREVYGDVHRFAEAEASEASADFAYTESTYSASKIAGEALIYSYARCYGLRYLVFRFSNVYGRYDNDLARRIEERAGRMVAAGVKEEVRRALAQPISGTAVQALGLREIAELPPEAALVALTVRTRRFAAYQRKWMRRISGLVSVNGDRQPDEIADEIVKVASAGQRLPASRAG